MILFQPAQFLPVRTIRKHRLHVASHRFLYQPVCIIEDAVGAFEGGYFRSRVINKARLYLLDHRKTEGILLPFQHSAFHLNIPEAIVGETRMPSFHPPLSKYIHNNVVCRSDADCKLLRPSGIRYKQGYFLPFLSTDGNFGEPGQVLSHIQHKGRRVHRPFG